MQEYKNLKFKNDKNMDDLLKFGFEKVDYSNIDGLEYKGIQYEFTDKYPLEEDGTRYEDENGFDYVSKISIDSKTRNIFIEVINNDCSYHIEGSEIDPLAIKIFELTNLGYLELKTKTY